MGVFMDDIIKKAHQVPAPSLYTYDKPSPRVIGGLMKGPDRKTYLDIVMKAEDKKPGPSNYSPEKTRKRVTGGK
jgi:hypothetical protein